MSVDGESETSITFTPVQRFFFTFRPVDPEQNIREVQEGIDFNVQSCKIIKIFVHVCVTCLLVTAEKTKIREITSSQSEKA